MQGTITEPVTFVVKYGISRKLIKVKDYDDLYDDVKSAFRNHPHFSQKFTFQFVHNDVEEYIDLDSPMQLLDQLNNNLLIIENPSIKNDDEEKESDDNSSDISK